MWLLRFAVLPLLLSACASGEYFEYSADGFRVERNEGGTCSDPDTTIYLLESLGNANMHLTSHQGSSLDAVLFVSVTGETPIRFTSAAIDITTLEDQKTHKLRLQLSISPDGSRDPTQLMTHSHPRGVSQFWFNLGLDTIPQLHSFTIRLPPAEVAGRIFEFPVIKAIRKTETYFPGLCLR
jgi:hypothetical protein